MDFRRSQSSRRAFLGSIGLGAVGAAVFTSRSLLAAELIRTPGMTEGPFYPDKLPLNTDNDLIIIKEGMSPAVGEIAHLTGRVLDANGAPLKGATIEIWQCDANQVYLHTSDSGRKQDQQDRNFQGFGRFETASDGGYRFRTIKPVPYPGRPSPHIHFKILKNGRELLTSQIFIEGHPGNRTDGVYNSAGDLLDRALVSTEFVPIKESKTGELAARFDVVVGRTPDDRELRG